MSHVFAFFFSSRRRHTRYWRDWSSDVCSSDLDIGALTFSAGGANIAGTISVPASTSFSLGGAFTADAASSITGAEIGRASCRKECRSGWWPGHVEKKRNEEQRVGYKREAVTAA